MSRNRNYFGLKEKQIATIIRKNNYHLDKQLEDFIIKNFYILSYEFKFDLLNVNNLNESILKLFFRDYYDINRILANSQCKKYLLESLHNTAKPYPLRDYYQSALHIISDLSFEDFILLLQHTSNISIKELDVNFYTNNKIKSFIKEIKRLFKLAPHNVSARKIIINHPLLSFNNKISLIHYCSLNIQEQEILFKHCINQLKETKSNYGYLNTFTICCQNLSLSLQKKIYFNKYQSQLVAIDDLLINHSLHPKIQQLIVNKYSKDKNKRWIIPTLIENSNLAYEVFDQIRTVENIQYMIDSRQKYYDARINLFLEKYKLLL